MVSYARGDIGPSFAATYRLPLPKDAPFTIGYTFEGKPHDYLPDVVGKLSDGKLFIAEAGMEDDKRRDRNLAKAEAARGNWAECSNANTGLRAIASNIEPKKCGVKVRHVFHFSSSFSDNRVFLRVKGAIQVYILLPRIFRSWSSTS